MNYLTVRRVKCDDIFRKEAGSGAAAWLELVNSDGSDQLLRPHQAHMALALSAAHLGQRHKDTGHGRELPGPDGCSGHRGWAQWWQPSVCIPGEVPEGRAVGADPMLSHSILFSVGEMWGPWWAPAPSFLWPLPHQPQRAAYRSLIPEQGLPSLVPLLQ